jgi:hypothetical protein
LAPLITSLFRRWASDSPVSPMAALRVALGVLCSSDSTDSISRCDNWRFSSLADERCGTAVSRLPRDSCNR